MAIKKKRKFKKGFKRFLFFLFLILLISTTYFLNREKAISINNILIDIKSVFIKQNTKEDNKRLENNDILNIFKTRLTSRGFTFASSSEISEAQDMKIFITKDNFNSGYIYVNMKDGAEYIWTTFISVIDAEPLKSKLKNDFKDLDYIDLRFSNKIFYKFKNNNVNLFKNNTEDEDKEKKSEENIELNDSTTSETLIQEEIN